MWFVVGVDEDGEKHIWNRCETKAEAEEKLQSVIPSHERMVNCYVGEIRECIANKNTEQIGYWKMQGFLIERFEIEEGRNDGTE